MSWEMNFKKSQVQRVVFQLTSLVGDGDVECGFEIWLVKTWKHSSGINRLELRRCQVAGETIERRDKAHTHTYTIKHYWVKS